MGIGTFTGCWCFQCANRCILINLEATTNGEQSTKYVCQRGTDLDICKSCSMNVQALLPDDNYGLCRL